MSSDWGTKRFPQSSLLYRNEETYELNMLEKLKNWLRRHEDDDDLPSPLELPDIKPPVTPKPRPKKESASAERPADVVSRPKLVREDTGTHETLTILDDSLTGKEEEDGLDPYNTGAFDRSKNWDNRFRK